MYECPNCGGNLKFEIASQLLKCDYCDTTQDPYSITKAKDAEESSYFDVTIFTCPQCGGEILSTDTSAAEFCSFCGASTILDSRISKEKRPTRIIPFQQTKEACKKAYVSRLKRALFAPDELKDEKYINSFRGIYMPYFSYSVSQQGPVKLKGKKSYRRGDYVYTDHYNLGGDLHAYYHDLSYDASSSFADNISQRIAPFNTKEMKAFTPSFLSGFYADTADVDKRLYEEDALELANTTSYQRVRKTSDFSGIALSATQSSSAISTLLHTQLDQTERVMFPVWFMSYRKGERIAYATVNGQTGKVAADIPVDIKKYVLGSLILALPVFILLNFFFTIKATTSLCLSAILALITLVIFGSEIYKIDKRDNKADDRGYLSLSQEEPAAQKKPKTYAAIWKNNLAGFAGSLLSILLAACILFLNPISDVWYYTGSMISFLGIIFTIIAIIRKYNVLSTRKLPQFDRKGGDNNA